MLSLGLRRIYFAARPADFRKSIDGLCAVVENDLGERPLSGSLFAFSNKRRTAVKYLYWDHGGFVLVYKRLERGQFRIPKVSSGKIMLTGAELAALLEGIDLANATRLKRWNPKGYSLTI